MSSVRLRRLDVPPTSSFQEIRRSYLGWAKKLHPDRPANRDNPDAHAQLARIGEAWAVLKSRRLRAVYDSMGKAGLEDLSDAESDGAEGSSSAGDSTNESDEESDGEGGSGSAQPNVAAFFAQAGSSSRRRPPPAALPTRRPAAATGSVAAQQPIDDGDECFYSIAANVPDTAAPSPPAPPPPPSVATSVRDYDLALQVADAVAEAIRRTEERAALRYERALLALLDGLDLGMDDIEARALVRKAWAGAAGDAKHDAATQ